MVSTAFAVALLALVAGCGAASVPLLSTDIQPSVTVPMDRTMRPNSTSLALNDPSLAGANATGNQPTQVHLSPAGPNALYVSWATGQAKTGKGALTPNDPTSVASIVKYGTSPSALTSTANGSAEVYSQIYNGTRAGTGGSTTLNYTSPLLHTCIMAPLKPDTVYFYQVGDGTTFSQTYSFISLAAAGPTYPQRVIMVADWGLSHNSTTTLDHILQSVQNTTSPPVVFYVADWVYADTWYANGTVSLPTSGFEGTGSSSWQPVWDTWNRFIEPLVSAVPMQACVGNHEIEQQDDATASTFASVQARWKMPWTTSNSTSYHFHSSNIGPVHAIFISPYVDYTWGSPQYLWLRNDLQKVDRQVTPWVVVNVHNPWFTTDPSYKEWEQMRIALEPLMYNAGVDIVFYGHVHAYERTNPMFNWNNDPCGAVHITIGDGGNTEGLSFLDFATKSIFNFEDLNGGCPNVTTSRPAYIFSTDPTKRDDWTYYQRTLTFQADGNTTGIGNPPGYCYKSQPSWSAYREPSFGHGTLDALNSTHALWQWHRNQDANLVTADTIYIIRNTTQCPNRLGVNRPAAKAPSAAPAPAPFQGAPAENGAVSTTTTTSG